MLYLKRYAARKKKITTFVYIILINYNDRKNTCPRRNTYRRAVKRVYTMVLLRTCRIVVDIV